MNWNKILGVAAVVSVVVNLLLAGFIVGRIIPERRFADFGGFNRTAPMPPGMPSAYSAAHGDGPASAMQPGNLNIGLGARVLSESSREIVLRIVQEGQGNMRETLRAVRDKRREVFGLLSNTPEDIGSIEVAFGELSNLTAEAQASSQNIVLEIAKQLPEEERAAFLRASTSSRRGSSRR